MVGKCVAPSFCEANPSLSSHINKSSHPAWNSDLLLFFLRIQKKQNVFVSLKKSDWLEVQVSSSADISTKSID